MGICSRHSLSQHQLRTSGPRGRDRERYALKADGPQQALAVKCWALLLCVRAHIAPTAAEGITLMNDR